MALTIAFNNTSQQRGPRYPDGQTLLRRQSLRQSARFYKVGSRVRVHGMDGQVIAYNISEFGRWVSTSHPVIVMLDNGDFTYCRLSEIRSSEPRTNA